MKGHMPSRLDHPYSAPRQECSYITSAGVPCGIPLMDHFPQTVWDGPPPKWPCMECRRPVVPTSRGKAPRHFRDGTRTTCAGSGVMVDTGRR